MMDPIYSLSLTDQELKVLAALLKLHLDQIGNEKDYRVQAITDTLRTIRDKVGNVRTAIALREDPINADTHSHTTR